MRTPIGTLLPPACTVGPAAISRLQNTLQAQSCRTSDLWSFKGGTKNPAAMSDYRGPFRHKSAQANALYPAATCFQAEARRAQAMRESSLPESNPRPQGPTLAVFMSVTTSIKKTINMALRPVKLKLETLTAEQQEAERIRRQVALGQFDKPAFQLLHGMELFDAAILAGTYAKCRDDVERLMQGAPPAFFDRTNNFYSTPDAEILYLMVRSLAPKRIVEIGSGNSTLIIRQAIADAGLGATHIAIDPEPRADITGFVDRVLRCRFEETDVMEELRALEKNDILFIDSSHQVHVANDVAKLFCNVVPALTQGVAIHVHDIFLPFDYPEPFCADYSGWGEQYLVQVMLAASPREILWPGYFVQKLRPELGEGLPFLGAGRAQSFWFRT